MALSEPWLRANVGKSRSKVDEFADRDGMGVRISPKGKVVFQYRYRFDGKAQRIDLGTYPSMSLKEARDAVTKERRLLDEGKNPRIEKQVAAAREQSFDSFEDIFMQFYNHYCMKFKKGHHEILRSFEIYVFPVFGGVRADTITLRQWMDFLDALALEKPSIAGRILYNSQQMYKWAMRREYVKSNILLSVSGKHDLQLKKNVRDRVLSDEEMTMILYCLEHCNMHPRNKAFVKLCLLYGCRNGELRLAKKKHFDFNKGVWTVPPENHKTGSSTGKPLLRPITPQVEEIIKDVMELSTGEYCFFGESENTPMTKSTPLPLPYGVMQWIRGHYDINMEHWSMHDLRRTARTNFSKLTTYEVAETMLGHALPKIQATYDHYDYLKEQREAYLKWHAYVCALKFDG